MDSAGFMPAKAKLQQALAQPARAASAGFGMVPLGMIAMSLETPEAQLRRICADDSDDEAVQVAAA